MANCKPILKHHTSPVCRLSLLHLPIFAPAQPAGSPSMPAAPPMPLTGKHFMRLWCVVWMHVCNIWYPVCTGGRKGFQIRPLCCLVIDVKNNSEMEELQKLFWALPDLWCFFQLLLQKFEYNKWSSMISLSWRDESLISERLTNPVMLRQRLLQGRQDEMLEQGLCPSNATLSRHIHS